MLMLTVYGVVFGIVFFPVFFACPYNVLKQDFVPAKNCMILSIEQKDLNSYEDYGILKTTFLDKNRRQYIGYGCYSD